VSGSDPEETMPFTHRPYGSHEPADPWTSPSGASSHSSGADFVPPSAALPPAVGPPAPGPVWGSGYTPAYGPPMYGNQVHGGATRARTLGIVALVSAGIAFFCCLTIPGVFAAPFAWVIGARAKREIDAHPGVYRNRGDAEAGVVMGIIGTVLGALVVAGVLFLVVAMASVNWTLV
jgi:hypothetical protein